MLETPESRARLRRKLELCPDWKRSPVSINAGLELLDMVERQEKMIDWFTERVAHACTGVDCPQKDFRRTGQSYWERCKQCWREAARRAVEEK